MLSSQAATQQCFQLGTQYGGLLPSDLDGSTPPPAGSPNYIAASGRTACCSGSSTSTGPRPRTRRVDHSVVAGSSVGVRWYELRSPNTTPTVYQQGNFAPDGSYRWMGSAAMDHNSAIALGYSVSCTFWYTNEYLASTGSFNWHTRIGAFKLSGCGTTTTTSDFSLAASPSSLSVAQGGTGTSTISTAVTSGSAQTVSLSASGQPAGTTVSFNPSSVNSGTSSTMTVNVGASTATGTYTITVTGTGTSATHTATVTLTVTGSAPPGALVNGASRPATSPAGRRAAWSRPPSSRRRTPARTPRTSDRRLYNGDSSLTQTVVIPSGNSQLTLWYQPHCPDTLTYDQIQMQVHSTAVATLATVMNVCSNSGAWTQVPFNMSAYAGQTVVLWFNDHDDGYPTDPTCFILDDVSVK